MEREPQCEAMMALEFDMSVRKEASVGFHQIRSIEHQLRIAPQGSLGRLEGPEQQAVRATILSASATIVGSFSKIISLLSEQQCKDRFSPSRGASQDRIYRRAESPHNSDVATPPHVSRRLKNGNSQTNSPARNSVSGSGMSDSSPPHADLVGLDSDGANDASTSAAAGAADTDLTEQRLLAKKRKFMPKYICKQRGTGLDPANDGPPDDGHTWRKYGQKEILGSRFQRSYYRCTHKHELGCPAIKYVQRSDEEPMVFDVTYRGNHCCQEMQQQLPWPFPFSREQIAMALTGLPPTELGGPNHISSGPDDRSLGHRPQFQHPGQHLGVAAWDPPKQSVAARSEMSPSNSMEVSPVKVEDNAPHNNLFSLGSNLLNLMMSGSRTSSSQSDAPTQNPEASHEQIDRSQERQYGENSWGRGAQYVEDFGRINYTGSGLGSVVSRDRGWHLEHVMEGDPSDLPATPFPFGFQLDSPVGTIDYESLMSQYSY